MELRDIIPPNSFIKRYFDFATPLTEAPSKMHISNACICLAGCAGRNVCMPWGASFLYPNIYKIDIGKSGVSRKSTTNNIAKEIIQRVDPSFLLPDYQSVEALMDELRVQPQRIAMFDEFKTLIDNSNKTYGQGLIPLFTKFWDCPTTYKVGFKNIPSDKRTINTPCISIAAASTADWIQLEESDIEGGFWGRFLISRVEDEGRIIPIPEVASITEIDSLAKYLKALTTVKGQFEFQTDARTLYQKIYTEHKKDAIMEENH